ncbi:hypothetical protein D3OALGB2SA_3618 [Olavius algarvensis associated proteobacterium Delta 3]|nr:hypothetical protein D3OALGB2SA_3618 [Olavius algarvensis associated proteobacterium Delta 3]
MGAGGKNRIDANFPIPIISRKGGLEMTGEAAVIEEHQGDGWSNRNVGRVYGIPVE